METVIQVNDIKKRYDLGSIGGNTLLSDIKNLFAGNVKPSNEVIDNEAQYWALKGVSFEVKQGEVLGIIGKNGAGKSTMLKILSRITSPTQGSIKVKGRMASLLEVGTGFHPDLSGRDNVFLNGAILGMKRVEIQNRFDEIVEFAGIAKYIDTPVKRYSSGMYVRLAFAVAAHLEPEILILDEVLAVGDAEFQKRCLGKMKDVSEGGRTVLFVSHNMNAVKDICSRAVLLSGGKVIKDGPSEDVVSYYMQVVEKTETAIVERDKWSNADITISGIYLNGTSNTKQLKLNVCEETTLRVEYDVKKAYKGLHAYVNIKSIDGELIVSLPSPLLHTPGKASFEVTIPDNFLNAGLYLLDIGFSDFEEVFVSHVHKIKDAIKLHINDDPNSFTKKVYDGLWSGMLRTDFEWKINDL